MTSREMLVSGAQKFDLDLSSGQVTALLLYLDELVKWNRKINLTSITSEREMVIKHLLDSLSYIVEFNQQSELRLLDMGSGAGFPGIPIRIACPGMFVTLVEATGKKASFLRHIVRLQKLDKVEIVEKRVEHLSDGYRSAYDLVTARAFAEIGTALQFGAPLMKPGGRLILSRGPEEAVQERDVAATGLIVERSVPLTLPYSEYGRVVWIFKRVVG